MAFIIQKGDIQTVVELSKQISNFHNPYAAEEYQTRLSSACPHLILVAYADEKPVGFKVGYEREKGYFYSWMGGVLLTYRRRGIAKQLAEAQETWAKAQGYSHIRFKTLNRHRAMLHFALQNDFHILAIESRTNIEEYRIWLQKELSATHNAKLL